jgi:hypothetical protein
MGSGSAPFVRGLKNAFAHNDKEKCYRQPDHRTAGERNELERGKNMRDHFILFAGYLPASF